MNIVSESYRRRLQELSAIDFSMYENKEKKEKEEIQLPDLTMNKEVLLKYLKDTYGIEFKN